MLVCVCFGVSVDDIEDLVREGFSQQEIASMTGASMGCGQCSWYLKNMCLSSEEKNASREDAPDKAN